MFADSPCLCFSVVVVHVGQCFKLIGLPQMRGLLGAVGDLVTYGRSAFFGSRY